MAIHYSVDWDKLDDEVQLLKQSGKRVIAIVPELIKLQSHYSKVICYSIIFEDTPEPIDHR